VIRIAIADDHAIVRAGLAAVISCESDLELVGEACDGSSAIDLAINAHPDVFLMDLSMPKMDGVEAIGKICSTCPRTKVIVLTMHASPDYVRPALRAGAWGYLVKGPALDELVRAIRAVYSGEKFLDPAAQALAESADAPRSTEFRNELDLLTPRELEVLKLVAMGHTNRTIAEQLGLSPKTVDAHRTNLMRKLELHDAQGLTRFAMRKGLLS
jgi:DNA-binding NarL/FixJ family response regulator